MNVCSIAQDTIKICRPTFVLLVLCYFCSLRALMIRRLFDYIYNYVLHHCSFF